MANNTTATRINDLFSADRALSENVTLYMYTRVWAITARKRHQLEVESLENLLSIATGNIRDAQTEEGRAAARDRARDYVAQINAANEEYATVWESRPKYTVDARDKALYKAWIAANNDTDRVTALQNWFGHYHLEVDADFCSPFLYNMGGMRGATDSKIVRSGAEVWTDNRTQNDILKTFYSTLCEKMLRVGTIKPTAVPEDIAAAYAPKKRVTPKNN